MPAIHPSITEDRLIDAVERTMHELENIGFCTACGHEQDGVEPDAIDYRCDACEAPRVCGAEHLLMLHATLDR